MEKMSEIHNLKSFKEKKKLAKKAKVQVEHLHSILKALDLSMKALSFFEIYGPVHNILFAMRIEKKNLEKHLKEQTELLKDNK